MLYLQQDTSVGVKDTFRNSENSGINHCCFRKFEVELYHRFFVETFSVVLVSPDLSKQDNPITGFSQPLCFTFSSCPWLQ